MHACIEKHYKYIYYTYLIDTLTEIFHHQNYHQILNFEHQNYTCVIDILIEVFNFTIIIKILNRTSKRTCVEKHNMYVYCNMYILIMYLELESKK